MEDRRLAAIMFTDIVGYTALMGSDEDKAFEVLRKSQEIHTKLISQFNGTLIKEMGDGMLICFQLSSEAVRCAIAIQKACKEQDIPLKIGIHEGEMVFAGKDVLGDSVNIASRLQEDAEEGGIYISSSVYKDIKSKADINATFVGEKTFKNVDEPVKVYKIVSESEKRKSKLEEPKKGNRKYLYYLFGGVVVVIAAILIWKYLPTSAPPAFNKEKSIAVMPFDNESADPDNQYFVNGMMEDIRNNLSKIADLRVISKTSTEKYRETALSSTEIGNDLSVNYLLEGTVQKQGDHVKIHAQLIDTDTDDHVWTETYQRDIVDVFTVQAEIAEEIADALFALITPEEKERIESIPTENLEAYDLFLKGKDSYWKGGETNISIAIHFYEQALELDPEFGLAYVWLGKAYYDQSYWTDYFKETLGDTLLFFANKALRLNQDLSEAYWLRGIYYQQNGDFDRSIIELEKAIKLNPSYGDACMMLGYNYLGKGQVINGLINFEKAKKLKLGDPDYSKSIEIIGGVYHMICDYERTESARQELINHNPVEGYLWLGWLTETSGEWEKLKLNADKICSIDSGQVCMDFLNRFYWHTRDYENALKYYEKYVEIAMRGGDPSYLIRAEHRHAYTLANLGRDEEAKDYYNKQIENCNESIRLNRSYAMDGGAYYDLAGTYAILGEKEKAYQILHKIPNELFNGYMVWFMQNDHLYESLWEEKEFKQIIQRQEKKFADIRAELDEMRAEGIL